MQRERCIAKDASTVVVKWLMKGLSTILVGTVRSYSNETAQETRCNEMLTMGYLERQMK